MIFFDKLLQSARRSGLQIALNRWGTRDVIPTNRGMAQSGLARLTGGQVAGSNPVAPIAKAAKEDFLFFAAFCGSWQADACRNTSHLTIKQVGLFFDGLRKELGPPGNRKAVEFALSGELGSHRNDLVGQIEMPRDVSLFRAGKPFSMTEVR